MAHRLNRYRNTKFVGDEQNGSVILHRTTILKWTPKWITFDTGGYDTLTTRRRMNETLGHMTRWGRVFRTEGVTFVRYAYLTIPLIDGLTLPRDWEYQIYAGAAAAVRTAWARGG